MDLTPIFNEFLLNRNAEPISRPVFTVSKLNEFIQEAHRINSHTLDLAAYLRNIRPSYLTLQPHRPFPSRSNKDKIHTAHGLTDNDRTRIDHETKALLTGLNVAIRKLSEVIDAESDIQQEIIRRKRRKMGFGALGQWAAGGGFTGKTPEELEEEAKVETTRVWREAVVWFLQRRLEEVSEFQMNMVQIRLDRERERGKSILYRTQGPSTTAIVNGGSSLAQGGRIVEDMGKVLELEGPQQDDGAWKDLSPEQLQIFEKEQQDMLKQYNDELNKIKTAESSLLEISSLQSQLAMNLETQSAHIDQLVQDSYLTTEQVGSGNKELKKASERPSTARMVFWATCSLCAVLTLWDFFI
jgi:hypothetical protein